MSKEINLNNQQSNQTLVSNPKVSLPPIQTILTFSLLAVLLVAFFNGTVYQFYASFLFFFYSLVKKMWISVILLGVFQTLLMIPFRIINLRRSINIKELKNKIKKITKKAEQQEFLKEKASHGNFTFLWYVVNFFVQTISYLSIGRLFLTDFYNTKLSPDLLYSFVSYPDYPIQGLIFKLPFPVVIQTKDFGMSKVWIAWVLIIVYKIIIDRLIVFIRSRKKKFVPPGGEGDTAYKVLRKAVFLTSSSAVIALILSYFLIRHFPIQWDLRIFKGDVSKPNSTLNLITAIATFLMIVWLDLSTIGEKLKVIRQKETKDVKIIKKMQINLFKDTFKRAFVLGLGAYLITNMIPSAFELSIFTLEIISFLSPLTLDKLIFKIKG